MGLSINLKSSIQNQESQHLKLPCRIALSNPSSPELIRKDNPNVKIVPLKSVNFSKSVLIRLQSALHCTQSNVA